MTAVTVSAESAPSRDRVRTAYFSVAAACFLVTVKLVTGILTGSLGLLAEAAHSGTDLVAALLTLFALRVAIRPADDEHQYGHGKAEHLAALAESAFLALVSAFIGYQALHRLLGSTSHEVEAHWWAIGILGVVIAVDAWRTIASRRASRKYHSAALAANALHFASDLAGSVAVLIGLVLVNAGHQDADSVAALIVAVIVIVIAIRLALDSIDVLMDRAPSDARDAIQHVLAALDEGIQVRRVRTRHAAGRHFVDIVVGVAADAGITQAHAAADHVEEAVREALPDSDVLVHVEPLDSEGNLRERCTVAALGVPDVREVHNVRVMHVGDGYECSLHAKLPSGLTLDQAHRTVNQLEASVRAAVPEIARVYTHIEPLAHTDWTTKPGSDQVAEERGIIDHVVTRYTGTSPMDVRFRDSERGRIAFVTVALPGEQPLAVAHRRASLIEGDIRDLRPELADVIVHTEPGLPGEE